jgi:hypothetical protein
VVVRTSRRRRREFDEDEIAVREAISQLYAHPAWAVLEQEVTAARDKFFTNFAAGLAMRREPVDQREVDEKRGFWAGAIWALTVFPKKTSREYTAFVEDALKESETLGG